MSAAEVIEAARAAGVRIGVEGDALTLEADTEPPEHVIEALASHKAEVLELLRAEARAAAAGLLFHCCHFCAGEGAGCTFCQGTGAKACPRCLGQGGTCAPCRGTGRMVIETDFDRDVDELRRARALLAPPEATAQPEPQEPPAIDIEATDILRRHAARLGIAPETVRVLAGGHYAPARPPIALPMHIAEARARLYAAARLMGLSAWRVQVDLPAESAEDCTHMRADAAEVGR